MQGIPRFWLAHGSVYRSTVRLAAILRIGRSGHRAARLERALHADAQAADRDGDGRGRGHGGIHRVTEPYSCGIGGGGFMVVYRASDGSVSTIESRETAPAAFQPDSFIDPATGQPIPLSWIRPTASRRWITWPGSGIS